MRALREETSVLEYLRWACKIGSYGCKCEDEHQEWELSVLCFNKWNEKCYGYMHFLPVMSMLTYSKSGFSSQSVGFRIHDRIFFEECANLNNVYFLVYTCLTPAQIHCFSWLQSMISRKIFGFFNYPCHNKQISTVKPDIKLNQ